MKQRNVYDKDFKKRVQRRLADILTNAIIAGIEKYFKLSDIFILILSLLSFNILS